jgi:tRNA nucleotidyltransferase/poly(A) polymerase
MEMNYMLAYGAAAPSILLLMKFKLLHVLLPFQAAYLDQASKTSLSSSLMLVVRDIFLQGAFSVNPF